MAGHETLGWIGVRIFPSTYQDEQLFSLVINGRARTVTKMLSDIPVNGVEEQREGEINDVGCGVVRCSSL